MGTDAFPDNSLNATDAQRPELRIALRRAGHLWLFRGAPGDAAALLRAAAAHASGDNADLDAFDLAAVAHAIRASRRGPLARAPVPGAAPAG